MSLLSYNQAEGCRGGGGGGEAVTGPLLRVPTELNSRVR